jgi:hypothetical protein
MTRGIVIVYKAARQPWRGILVARVAPWARHAGTAARARVRASPRPLRMVLANPSTVFAPRAFHRAGLSRRLFRATL